MTKKQARRAELAVAIAAGVGTALFALALAAVAAGLVVLVWRAALS